MVEQSLSGRVAVVTGGGRGIGASTAAHLARRGANVVVAARTEQDVVRVAAALEDLGRKGGGAALGMPVVCDVSDPEQVEALFAEVDERFGPVDVLVNNAGIVTPAPLAETSFADWREQLATNLNSVFLCSKAALARMRPRGSGVIINVASVAGVSGVARLPGLVPYATTKAGVIAFSEALAAEVRGEGVRVVALSPGSVDTGMLRAVAPDATGATHPGDIGKVIAFLASDEAVAMTQTNVVVWGPPDSPAKA